MTTFTCEACHQTFDKSWTDEEAKAEALRLFPGLDVHDPTDAAVVCDDCWQSMMTAEEQP